MVQLCRAGRKRECVEMLYSFLLPLNLGSGQVESQASEIEGKTEDNQGEESSRPGRGKGQEGCENG
jgi:hypothetical protein